MKSIFNGAGYLLSDNRASDWGTKDEDDMLGCGHCGALIRRHGHWEPTGLSDPFFGYHQEIYIPGWQEDGSPTCPHCRSPLCGKHNNNCRGHVKDRGCEHVMMTIDKAIDEAHRREQNAKILGI